MPQVFVSYARSTEAQAQQVAGALRSLDHEVWRDEELPVHRAYNEVMQERLRAAGAVVVIWSAEAAGSKWVRAHADAAREKGKLVQVSVDGTVPPTPFNQIQCADLHGWNGDLSAPGWRELEGSVTALVGRGNGVSSPASADGPPKVSVCVLPFVNISGDAEQEYFSDGISEDITTDLSDVSALSVVARNTAFTFKSNAVDATHVAGRLGVSHVIEGSVQKAGSRVRITAQLIDGRTGDHVWAERYDRDLTDIFAIQDEILEAIVAALKLTPLPDETKAIEGRGTASAEAYNLYLMARQYWVTGNHGDRRREECVERICQRAIEIDRNYARAWALLALAQVNLRFAFGAMESDGLAAAERALELDPSIAEAHCVVARHLSECGDIEEANEEIEMALWLDRESWEVNREAARLCMSERRIPEAAAHYAKTVAAIESDYHSWAMLVMCYQALGDREGVVRGAKMMLSQAEKVLAGDPGNGAALGICAAGLAILGEGERARERIDRALLIDPDNLNMRYNFACVLAGYLRDSDAALDLLGPVFDQSGPHMVKMAEVDPDLDLLRDDPRFEDMLAEAQDRLGIEPAPATPAASEAPLRS